MLCLYVLLYGLLFTDDFLEVWHFKVQNVDIHKLYNSCFFSLYMYVLVTLVGKVVQFVFER